MILKQFTASSGSEVWINPEMVVAVLPYTSNAKLTTIRLQDGGVQIVQESVSFVVNYLQVGYREWEDEKA